MAEGDRKTCHYRCPDCGNEWMRSFERGERKVKGWCKPCKQFVTPFQTVHKTTTENNVRVMKPKSLW
jgi:hypothetical protein